MSTSGTADFAGLAGLAPGDPMDSARLLGVIMALAGEVFVLKAEVERLKQALQTGGFVDAAQLDAAGNSAQVREWMGKEQRAFGAALLRPFTHPDESPDVTRFMSAS